LHYRIGVQVIEQIKVRTSERRDFKTCRQKWWWAYVENLTSMQIRPALGFGDLCHQALAIYYPPGIKRGPHPAGAFEKLYKDFVNEHGTMYMKVTDDEPAEDAYDLGMEMLTGYVEHWGKDDRWKIIQPEQPIKVRIFRGRGPAGKPIEIYYVCVMDAVVLDRQIKKYGLFEHKTTGSMRKFGAPLALDEQAGSYWTYGYDWMLEQNFKSDFDFIMYNFLRKGHKDDRPTNQLGQSLNKDGSVSKRQPNPLFWREPVMRSEGDRETMKHRVMQEVEEMELCRRGKLAIYKNPDDHCYWCQFKDMCEVHETGSDWESMKEELYIAGNPYEVYENRT
jgi:hypothetical protein